MTKFQILLSTLALGLTFVLFNLPKSVVNTKTKSPQQQPKEAHSTDTKKADESLMRLAQAFRTSMQDADLDTLVAKFKAANFYDSAAFYTGLWAEKNAQALALSKAGDAYQEAAVFALEKQKREQLLEKALAFYQKALEKNPQDLDLEVKIGMVYTMSPEPMKGILAIREVLNKNPKHELALYQMGVLAVESGQIDKAIERFEALLQVNAQHIEANFLLGRCFMEKKQNQKAIPYFKFVSQNAQDQQLRQNALKVLAEIQ